jgi:hypothetical protein
MAFHQTNDFDIFCFTGSGRNWINHLIEMSTGTQTSDNARTTIIYLDRRVFRQNIIPRPSFGYFTAVI